MDGKLKRFFIRKKGLVKGLLYILAPVFILSGFQAWAADEKDSKSRVFELGEVVVSAPRLEPETPTTIAVVTAEDIERQNATNLGEALRLLPGVYFRQARSKSEYYITLRGFEQENVLILLDGIPINVPYEGLVNLMDIPTQNIAEIKVVKGISSSLYGPNAMGGVINVITKKGTKEPSFAASYQGSEYRTHHLEMTHGYKVGKFSYFLGASHKESEGYRLAETYSLPPDVIRSMQAAPTRPANLPNVPPPADEGSRDNSDYNRNALTFTGSYDFTNNHKLGLSLEYYKHNYGVPPVPIYRETQRGFYYFPRYWRFSDWERFTANLIEESKFCDTWRMKFRVFYDSYYNILDAYDDPRYTTQIRQSPASGKSIYDDYSAGGNYYLFWDGMPRNNWRLGFSFKRDVHREKFNQDPYDELSADTYSIALEDEIRITKDLRATVGVSYDMFDKRVREQFANRGAPVGDDEQSFNPQAGLRYAVAPGLNLYGSVGRKSRFPTMRNLYASGVIGPQGDPNLKEEWSYNYDIGGNWAFSERFMLDGALFYSDVHNLINFDNQIGRFEQYEKARLYGIEISISSQIMKTLLGRISYTYLKAETDSTVTIKNQFFPNLVYRPDQLPYRPEHKIDFELSQRFDFGLKVDFTGSWIGERPYYNHADTKNTGALVAKKEYLSSFFLANLRIGQTLWKRWEIFMSVDNLFNQNYQDLYQTVGRGMTFWGGLKFQL